MELQNSQLSPTGALPAIIGKRPPLRRNNKLLFVIAVVAVLAVAGLFSVVLVLSKFTFNTANTQAAVVTASQRYLAAEGYDRKGSRFADAAMAVNMYVFDGSKMSEAQLFSWLGPPDLVSHDRKSFAYFYDRFGRKDWVVYFFRQGENWQVAWNDATVNKAMHDAMISTTPATKPVE